MNPIFRLLERIAAKYGPTAAREAPSAPSGPDRREADLEALCGLLVRFEGTRLEAYKCSAGRWTIGVGATRTLGNRPVREGMRITPEQCDALLRRDAGKALDGAIKMLRPSASSGARICFASLIFNVGIVKVRRSRARTFYDQGKLGDAEREFLEFRLVNGKPSRGLERRRRAEWKLIKDEEKA